MAGTLSRSKPSPVTGVVATTWNAGIWRAGAGVDGGEGAGAETRGGGGEGAGAGAETGGDGAARAGLAAGVTLRTGGRSRGGETVISGSVSATWARAALSSVNASGSIKAPSATAPNRRRLLTLSREAARSTSPATHTARPRLAYEPLLWTNPSGLSGYLLPIRIGTFGNVAPRPHVPILDRQPASSRKLIGSRQRRASFSSRTFLRARAGLLSLHYRGGRIRSVQLVHLATLHKVPATYALREIAEVGGLMSYGVNITEALRGVTRARNGRTTALFAFECKSFLDNIIAGLGRSDVRDYPHGSR